MTVKPTPAQLQRLREVQRGALRVHGMQRVFYEVRGGTAITATMVDRLELNGWIEWSGITARLTEAGRAALKSNTP